jgi:tripartite-type tricarboxylate transporter receptor subunit TctC
MKPSRARVAVALATLFSIVTVACAPAAPPSPTTKPAAPAAAPAAPAAPAASPAAQPKAAESKPATAASPVTAPAAKPVESPAAAAKPAAPSAAASPPAAAAAPKSTNMFYSGKTITFLAGSTPGGGTDTLARITARYMPRFIPGSPNIIVQNMAGGGGIPALNHLFNVAKSDGLTFDGSIAQTVLYAQIEGVEQVRYDLRKATYVGNAIVDPQVLWVRSDSPYTSLDAIRSATTPPKLGAQAGTHPSVVIPKIVGEITGLNLNVVTGYPGSPEIFLDVERGALDGRFASYGSLQTQRPDWIKDNYVRILMTTARQRLPELPDVPSISEIIPPERQNYLSLLFGPQDMSRSVLGHPEIPPEVAKIMQDSFAEMVKDPEFASDMQKAGFDVGYTSPNEIRESVVKLIDDPELKTTLNRLLAN